MFDMYGKAFKDIKRVSTNGHDAPYITDEGMALTEGWAEAFEALYGPANPKLKEKDRKKYNISEFLFSRQDPIRRDRYIWAKYFGKKTGALKNGLQLVSTEGVVAGQFYDILSSRAINAPFEKCVTTMLIHQPKNYPEFVQGFVKLYPEDKSTLFRIVLEGLNYAVMSNEARNLYHSYYRTKLDYVQKKISNAEHLKAKQAFLALKEDLFKKAMAGENLFANVGPQLWFSGEAKLDKKHGFFDFKYKLMKKLGVDLDAMPFNLDLNTATAKMLSFFGGMEPTDAEKIVSLRDKVGFFTGDPLKVLNEILGAQKFQSVKSKNKLKPFEPKNSSDPNSQATTLWPEDFERLRTESEL
ncbi:hypothetical protein HYY75_09405 [bacterium]|nr:hypothetical protein [bacterium]